MPGEIDADCVPEPDHVAPGDLVHRAGAEDARVVPLDGTGLAEVEGLALGHVGDDVHEDDIPQLPLRDALGLGEASTVVTIVSEGMTDPVLWQQIVGRA